MGNYECPLCHQSVSANTYNKITGIWAERQRKMAQIKLQELKLKKERVRLITKMKEQQSKFKKQREDIKRVTLKKVSEQFERKFKVIKKEKTRIEEQAKRKIELAIKEGHNSAQKEFRRTFDMFKRESAREIKKKIQ